jgi:hypothetical protein
MLKRKDDVPVERILAFLERHWKIIIIAACLITCGWWAWQRWSNIVSFNLGDTDDNMRMMQVRALLHGQDWFDLRQYRLNPPFGANIHWSRLVDLPIAGLILSMRPFFGGADAERIAAGVAPMLPYCVLLFGVALTARRLIDPRAYFLPVLALIVAGLTNSMYMPERLDHHGWQLALLALSVAGLADPRRARGGITLGITTALSLAIGLEMIIYLAIAGAAVALFWVADASQKRRAIAYAVSLGGGVAFCFLVFASYDNRIALCDALTPVWLSDLMLVSALLLGAALLSPADWRIRLGMVAAIGLAVGGYHALAWPQCLGRPENVSPETYKLWLSHVREARPVYRQTWQIATLILALPLTATIGWALLAWRNRKDGDLLRRTLAAWAPAFAAGLLLMWQVRTGPAAQMLAAVGSIAIIWVLAPLFERTRNAFVQVAGMVAIILVGLGAAVPLGIDYAPQRKLTPREIQVERANRMCNFIGSYHPIALLPKGVVFTFIDLAPRLITVTHHDSIMGPYHRNGEQIVDAMRAFRGSADQAHQIIDKYHSDYLLTCPNSSTTTIFTSEAPQGFYAELQKGQVPAWLTPVPLGPDSPFRMWKVAR